MLFQQIKPLAIGSSRFWASLPVYLSVICRYS